MWAVLLDEFDVERFPVDRVAFEMVNEPGNWYGRHVRDRTADLLTGFVELIAGMQPERVLILPTEMGHPRCAPAESQNDQFVQSWEGLMRRWPGSSAQSLERFAALDHPVIGTFHFCATPHGRTGKPLPACSQTRSSDAPSELSLRGTDDPPRFTHQGNVLEHWDVASGAARVALIFDGVRAAVPSTLPFYVGEFGLDVSSLHRKSDGAAWLRTVRAFAHERGFAYALWTYYTSPQGVVNASHALGRLRQWDCSELVAAAFNFTVHNRAACGTLRPFAANLTRATEDGPQNYSTYSYDEVVGDGQWVRRNRRRGSYGDREWCDDGRPNYAPAPTTFEQLELPPCAPAPPPFVIPPPPSQLPTRSWPPPFQPPPPVTPRPSARDGPPATTAQSAVGLASAFGLLAACLLCARRRCRRGQPRLRRAWMPMLDRRHSLGRRRHRHVKVMTGESPDGVAAIPVALSVER